MMTRRGFVAGVVALVAMVPCTRTARKHVGYMDVERWFRENRHHQKVLLNGHDITDGCVWFNDITGEAECFKRNAAGEFYTTQNDPNRIASRILRGRIEVVG